MRRFLHTLLCIGIIVGFASCASYQMGQPGESDSYRSVYVKPVRNESTYPMLKASLTASLRKAIADTGFLDVATSTSADTVLETRVISVNREIAAVSSIDVGRGRKYELEFETLCTLYQKVGGQLEPVFVNRRINVKQDIFADSGQVNAEHQAGPEIARKIAQRVTESIVGTW